MKKRTIFNALMALFIVALGFVLYKQIQEPIAFQQTKTTREKVVMDKLVKIRKAQEAYRGVTGKFAPTFEATDLVNLGFAQIYLKLMIDGVSSQPFSATTMGPIAKPDISFKDAVIKASRDQFARPRADVEKTITDWHDVGTHLR